MQGTMAVHFARASVGADRRIRIAEGWTSSSRSRCRVLIYLTSAVAQSCAASSLFRANLWPAADNVSAAYQLSAVSAFSFPSHATASTLSVRRTKLHTLAADSSSLRRHLICQELWMPQLERIQRWLRVQNVIHCFCSSVQPFLRSIKYSTGPVKNDTGHKKFRDHLAARKMENRIPLIAASHSGARRRVVILHDEKKFCSSACAGEAGFLVRVHRDEI